MPKITGNVLFNKMILGICTLYRFKEGLQLYNKKKQKEAMIRKIINDL